MNRVRCMMTCQTAEPANANGEAEATFTAVTDGSKEAEEFFAATPHAEFSVGNLGGQHFEVGKIYYFDISPVSE